MSTEAQAFIESFRALPQATQREVEVEILNSVAKRNLGNQQHAEENPQVSEGVEKANSLEAEQWVRSFRAWADSHKLRNPNVDCSRESIYEGRSGSVV